MAGRVVLLRHYLPYQCAEHRNRETVHIGMTGKASCFRRGARNVKPDALEAPIKNHGQELSSYDPTPVTGG